MWESELLIWTESRYRELYLGDQPFPPGWTPAMTDVDELAAYIQAATRLSAHTGQSRSTEESS